MKLRRIALLLLLAAGLSLTPAAFAEEGEGAQDDLKARIKKKMERILELMAKNESALLKLSSGTSAETRKIDVPVPEGEGGQAGGAPESGRKAAEELAKLASESREEGGRIPDELKELVEMIPLWSSCSSQLGSPKNNQSKNDQKQSQKPEDMDPRDARKQLSDEQRNAQNQNDPKSGEKSPTDPARRMPRGGRPEEGGTADGARADDVPPWVTALPPEIRDALAGGQAEKIPARYRHLIARYNLYLQKKAGRK